MDNAPQPPNDPALRPPSRISPPIQRPTAAPTQRPTGAATQRPTGAATQRPTSAATRGSTAAPQQRPTGTATPRPSGTATQRPSGTATQRPSGTAPTQRPGSVGPDGAPALGRAEALVDLGLRACSAYDRPDLVDFLRRTRRKLAERTVHVVVVGEFKQGKSSLVNALIGANVCAVDDDIATAVPTYLRYGETAEAALLRLTDSDDADRLFDRTPLPITQLRAHILERDRGVTVVEQARTEALVVDQPAGVEVRLPSALLGGGITLVDAPGVGGLGSAHAAATLAAASLADAVIFVTDASQELTRAELDFLERARQSCDTVICALTKTDLYPAWRQVAELTESHLRQAGITAPILPVSSPLAAAAAAGGDAELAAESGIPALRRELTARVVAGAARFLADAAADDVIAVCDRIEAQLGSERAAAADPERAQQVIAELTGVRERIRVLKSAAAKWSQTLTDGTADLVSDIDHDLRRRIRDIVVEAEEAIYETDPADTWSEMCEWLKERVADEMLANYTLLRERAGDLSTLVGEHFRENSGEILELSGVHDPQPVIAQQDVEGRVDLKKMKVGKQAMVALKSAYGGAIIFVMLGTLTGVTIGPIALAIGLVMGHFGLREEKKRQRENRQNRAAASVRRYCDQVGFVMGKDSRDTLRAIQRELRDHYTELAQQLETSNSEALRRAGEVAGRSESDREQRLSDLDAEIGRIRQLRAAAQGNRSEAAVGQPK